MRRSAAPLLGLLLATSARAQAGVDARHFREVVQPVLAGRCLECHGGGERVRGGLRLTSRAALVRGGDSGPALDERDPAGSLLLRMIRWEDELHQMPPDGRLPEGERATLERWVLAGAPFDPALEEDAPAREPEGPSLARHDDGRAGWAYAALAAPAVPGSGRDHPIDAFVDARLAAAGLAPNPEADRITLIRRATYDLTGLPPTPAEVRAFVRDDAPDAWERLIDRLLASPAYGEKHGRYWLDLVRYAETNGFERDSDKPFVWRYRDWVIDSLNADKPFDRFCLEQLCGDELPDATPETRIATGYYRLPQWDDEPPQGPLQARYDVLDDVARTTSEVFLGTTIGCARCHDHPADPIPQEDYYSFVAFFDGLTDMSVDGYVTVEMTAEELADWSRREAERAARERELRIELDRRETDLRARLVARDGGRVYGDLVAVRRMGSDGDQPAAAATDGRFDLAGSWDSGPPPALEARLGVERSGSIRLRWSGPRPGRLAVAGLSLFQGRSEHAGPLVSPPIWLEAGAAPVRLELGRSAHLPVRLDWRRVDERRWLFTEERPSPGWFERDYEASGWRAGGPSFGEAQPHARGETPWTGDAIWVRREFDWSEPADAFALALFHDDDLDVWINGVPALSLSGYVTAYAVHDVADAARAALRPTGNVLAFRCRQDFGGRFVHVAPVDRRQRASASARDLAFGWRPLTRHDGSLGTLAALATFADRRAEVLASEERFALQALETELSAIGGRAIPKRRAATVQERAEIPDLHVHVRGNPNVPGAPVEPRFPSALSSARPSVPALPPIPEGVASSGRRRALAEWLVERPLFARVLANRVWQVHLGRGLVRSANDFGELGDRPTHPALLEWIAGAARERGWSLKALHRLVMTSRAYRRSSAANGAALARDPANDLFWRFDRRRLTAEEIRDALLATAGVLNRERGGPPFFARVSAEELQTSSTPDKVWGTSPREQTDRRSIYAKVKRSLRPATLQNFDAADTDASCPVRFETVQPAQALGLLNGAFAREMAGALADRLLAEGPPDGPGVEVGGAGIDALAARIGRALELALARPAEPDEVRRLTAFARGLERDFDLAPRDALADVCLIVFNLNEFLYLD